MSWEWFLENTFISYMLGERTDTGFKPQDVYIRPKDIHHAYDFVKEGKDYADWSSPAVVIRKAKLFFKDGEPYVIALQSIIQDIQEMKTLRNAIAHMSREARDKIETLVRSAIGYFPSDTSPCNFLSMNLQNSNKAYITYFKELLELKSGEIVS